MRAIAHTVETLPVPEVVEHFGDFQHILDVLLPMPLFSQFHAGAGDDGDDDGADERDGFGFAAPRHVERKTTALSAITGGTLPDLRFDLIGSTLFGGPLDAPDVPVGSCVKRGPFIVCTSVRWQ